ncbi:MAG: sigma-54-dependent Fis family transcriptional regulator [Oligoflexales bacterium]|nr:sigma-54-dependent Fis family transcriptional regulator [Oligoflexales bacterium]
MKALIIDDENSISSTLSDVITDEGWQVQTASSGEEGLIKFKSFRPQIVFLDVWMPGIDGIETLQRLKELDRSASVVVMSGHANIETAVKATRLGARDFLEKPMSLDKVIPILEKTAAEFHSQASASSEIKPVELIGDSEIIQDIKKQVQLVAPRNSWVFLTGENGTGKEVVARNIHFYSKRNGRPFIAVNCAAIPEELIESELFGYVKGAFSNATHTKKGKFELAHKGTLFLDEIGDMSLKTQAKVLRILQEQSFERLGDTETINIDVRVIAATNKNLDEEINNGRFRQDLYYRLNVIPIDIPPLRQRLQDVPLLLAYFLKANASNLAETEKFFTNNALNIMCRYSWPGNVRELKNLVERLCIMNPKVELDVVDLPANIIANSQAEKPSFSDFANNSITTQKNTDEDSEQTKLSLSLKAAKVDFEKAYLEQKLRENQWNISKTADAIGIERSNLHKKIKQYKIDISEK